MVRDDNKRPYTIRIPLIDEEVPEPKEYSRGSYSKSKRNMRTDISRPSANEVLSYLDKWNTLESYVAQERALEKLFKKYAPSNKSLDEILIKVATLNNFYSTNIKSVYIVAQHIHNLDIDNRLKVGKEKFPNKQYK